MHQVLNRLLISELPTEVLTKTFKGTATARSLFESDSQIEVAIEVAASHQMAKQLRGIFAYLCAF